MAICYVNRLIKDLPVWRLTCWTNDINLSYLDWISRIGEMFWQMLKVSYGIFFFDMYTLGFFDFSN